MEGHLTGSQRTALEDGRTGEHTAALNGAITTDDDGHEEISGLKQPAPVLKRFGVSDLEADGSFGRLEQAGDVHRGLSFVDGTFVLSRGGPPAPVALDAVPVALVGRRDSNPLCLPAPLLCVLRSRGHLLPGRDDAAVQAAQLGQHDREAPVRTDE